MKKIKIAADLHVHTISSGHAYSTVLEYVERAAEIGLQAFAVTDHGPAMPGGPHRYHFSNLRMIPPVIDGVRIYRGAEANIINENGDLDLDDDDLKGLDIVLAAMHPRVGYESQGEEKNTGVLLKAMRNPYVNIIAHPGYPKFPVSIPEVVSEAKRRNIAVEINNSSFTGSRKGSYDRCLEFAREVKRQEHFVAVGSDSHISLMLGGLDKALELAAIAGLSEKNVINTSLKKIEDVLIRKHEKVTIIK